MSTVQVKMRAKGSVVETEQSLGRLNPVACLIGLFYPRDHSR